MKRVSKCDLTGIHVPRRVSRYTHKRIKHSKFLMMRHDIEKNHFNWSFPPSNVLLSEKQSIKSLILCSMSRHDFDNFWSIMSRTEKNSFKDLGLDWIHNPCKKLLLYLLYTFTQTKHR